jgi:class 3 adenylate cyclase
MSGEHEAVAHFFPDVTVMFIAVEQLDALSLRCEPVELVAFLNDLYVALDDVLAACGVYKVMGGASSYLCIAGAHDGASDHAARVASAALRVACMMADDTAARWRLGGQRVQLKIGLNTGEIAAGVIGTRTFAWHVYGAWWWERGR